MPLPLKYSRPSPEWWYPDSGIACKNTHRSKNDRSNFDCSCRHWSHHRSIVWDKRGKICDCTCTMAFGRVRDGDADSCVGIFHSSPAWVIWEQGPKKILMVRDCWDFWFRMYLITYLKWLVLQVRIRYILRSPSLFRLCQLHFFEHQMRQWGCICHINYQQ